MRYILLLAFLVSSAFGVPLTKVTSTPDYRAFLVQYEGMKFSPYSEIHGKCVGIGHNLTAHHERVKSRYTQKEVNDFFVADLANALRIAHKYIPDFDKQPFETKEVVISLIWTVGATGFSNFSGVITAINYHMYNMAGNQLLNSKWYQQVPGDRSSSHYNLLTTSSTLQPINIKSNK